MITQVITGNIQKVKWLSLSKLQEYFGRLSKFLKIRGTWDDPLMIKHHLTKNIQLQE